MRKNIIITAILISLFVLTIPLKAENITINRDDNMAKHIIEFFNNKGVKNVCIDDLRRLEPSEITDNTGYYEVKLEDSMLFFSVNDQNNINYAYIEYLSGEKFYILEKESEPRTIETIKKFIKNKGARSITENDFNYLNSKKSFKDGIFENKYILIDGTLTLLFRRDETIPFAITLEPGWN